jgi:hypothetical protein
MKRIYNTINEEINRIKSLFTEERLYGGLVEQFGDEEKEEASKETGNDTQAVKDDEAEKQEVIKTGVTYCNKLLKNYESSFFNIQKNKRINVDNFDGGRVEEELGKLESCVKRFWTGEEFPNGKELLKVGTYGGNDVSQMIDLITKILTSDSEGRLDYLNWDLEKMLGMSNPFKQLSDLLDKRIKDGPLDPIKNKKKELKQEADTSFQACKSQLGKINKSLKKDGLTIDQYVEEYGNTLIGADGKPIEGLTSDILGGMVKGCLTKHHSKLGIYWDVNKNKYRGENNLGVAVERIIDKWKIKFEKESGGVMDQVYDIMKGSANLGKVKKTGRNKYSAKINKGVRGYAFKTDGSLDNRYTQLIKDAISIPDGKELDFDKENDKTGIVTFSLV